MEINSAKFIMSNSDYRKCPVTLKPEYAFIGRSNVGKSSLINMLTRNRKLAKTSGKPGKTQLINHFLINEDWYLVDLPGYGFAQVSKSQRRNWQKLINDYLMHRENLYCVFVLIDSRHEPQASDQEFMSWLGTNGIPFVIVFTKCDKLGKTNLDKNLAAYRREMLKTWEELPQTFITSSENGMGKEQILEFIDQINHQQ